METCTWLKLAGIGEVYPIDGDQDPFEILSNLWLREDISIIIISPNIAQHYHNQIAEFMAKNLFPVIIELPIKKEGTDPLTDLVRQAVGVKLNM
ncbi:MAG: hypothetical protein EAX86_11990 [Candidatus Heimdallarchaeota archaeon]|nr:hypothetical protein [Candidatus Heimdallarchaeota archaeon]